jgi:hypothetical protein
MRQLLMATMLMLAAEAAAEPAAVVEALQMPAWIERGSARAPLQVGYALESGDRIRTGSRARVLLRLQEGSLVKLGQDAQFNVDALAAPADAGGLFTGALNVVRGAFRFTTSAIGAARQRDIRARVATVTIGIRGTDVWGKADSDRDFVVLLEGRIDIARDGEPAQRMETPLTIYSAPRQAASEPVKAVDPVALKRWAAETELQDGAGIVNGGGGWTVVLLSAPDASAAQSLAANVQQAGYAADVEQVRAGTTMRYRVSVAGLHTRGDAEQLRQRIAREFALQGTTVVAQPR